MKEELNIALFDPTQSEVHQGREVEVHAQVLKVYEDKANKGSDTMGQDEMKKYIFQWSAHSGRDSARMVQKDKDRPWEATLLTLGVPLGTYTVNVVLLLDGKERDRKLDGPQVKILPLPAQGGGSVFGSRNPVGETEDLGLALAIRQGTEDISFNRYDAFISEVLCPELYDGNVDKKARLQIAQTSARRGTPFPGIDAYQTLKVATEVFLMLQTRVLADVSFNGKTVADYNLRHDRKSNDAGLQDLWSNYLEEVNGNGSETVTLPYLARIRLKLRDQRIVPQEKNQDRELIHLCDGIQQAKLSRPCFLELIWSYWHEEGMLVQTINAIARRFQNQRASARDPLANFDIDPLRPLSNLLWGYIQDEQHRLSIARRAYEYDHHYGITLRGKAVPALRSADSRSKFLEAFHNLLTACITFYKQDDNKMIIADSFPLLHALKEVHLLLAEGAHNQYGDLPSTARGEMLMQQWMLARPEMREFIAGRTMLPYDEPWMDHVDGMKRLQGWSDVTVTYFHELARFGEQLLLSIRWGHWSQVHQIESATNWAREWRSEIKQYIHAYRAVTGVDLAPEAVGPRIADRDLPPSVHLQRRLEIQQTQRPATDVAGAGSPRRQGANRNNGRAPAARSPGRAAELEFTEDL